MKADSSFYPNHNAEVDVPAQPKPQAQHDSTQSSQVTELHGEKPSVVPIEDCNRCSPQKCPTCPHQAMCYASYQIPPHGNYSHFTPMAYPQLAQLDQSMVFYIVPPQSFSPMEGALPIVSGSSPYQYPILVPSPMTHSAASRFMSPAPASKSQRRRGRPPKTIPEDTLRALVQEGLTQDEILSTLRTQGLHVSSSTLKRRLAKAGLSTRPNLRTDASQGSVQQPLPSQSVNPHPSQVYTHPHPQIPTPEAVMVSTQSASLPLPGYTPVKQEGSEPVDETSVPDFSQVSTSFLPYDDTFSLSLGLGDEDKISTSFDDISLSGFSNDFY
ncbi:hypothetical protein P9112_013884 [Eukaryota sp. TZLM1-RC]